MDRILEIDERNMYVVVEPYAVGSQIQVEAMRRNERDRGKPHDRTRCQGSPQLGIYSRGGLKVSRRSVVRSVLGRGDRRFDEVKELDNKF